MASSSPARSSLWSICATVGTVIACLASGTPALGVGSVAAPAQRSKHAPGTVLQSLAIPGVDEVPGPEERGAGGASSLLARLAPTRTPLYGLVAVTWNHGAAVAGMQITVRSHVDGAWTRWRTLEIDPDEGPSAAEESDVRDGTSPVWVGGADGVAVRVTSSSSPTSSVPASRNTVPDGMRVIMVAAGAMPDASSRSNSSFRAASGRKIKGAPAFPSFPDIVTRKEWGADPKLGDACWDPVYGTSAKMVFIHHTVNSNDYSPEESAAILRSIQAYHTQGRGWCDIGYNYLVDRYGSIYEGRRGGLRLPVRGAHSGDYNTNSVGISLIGNFDTAEVPAAMKNAVIRLVGWRLGTSYTPVKGTVRVNHKRFERISGHRDAMATTCPGRYAYAWLPRLRQRTHRYLSEFDSKIEAKGERLGRDVTGPVFVGEVKVRGGRHTEFGKGEMWTKRDLGTHWLNGRPLRAYRALHGSFGRLGFPRTDRRQTDVAGVTSIAFESGRMFTVPQGAPKTLWGRVLLRYLKLGSVSGALGLPTSSVRVNGTVERATFEHGSISWDRTTDNVTVVSR